MAIDFDEALDAGDLEVTVSMNTTPLIDVLLVLLVMLIITIPIQLHSVNMEMPAGAPLSAPSEPLVVRIEVGSQNQLLWNGEPVAGRVELTQRLQAAAELSVPPEIHIRAHRSAKYDTVAAMLTAAQQAGLQKIGVVGLDEYASRRAPGSNE